MEILKKFDESEIRDITDFYTLAALVQDGLAFDDDLLRMRDDMIKAESLAVLIDYLDRAEPRASEPSGIVALNGSKVRVDASDDPPHDGVPQCCLACFRGYAILLKWNAESDDRLHLVDRYELQGAAFGMGIVPVMVGEAPVIFQREGQAWRVLPQEPPVGEPIPPKDAPPYPDISELCDEVEAQLGIDGGGGRE